MQEFHLSIVAKRLDQRSAKIPNLHFLPSDLLGSAWRVEVMGPARARNSNRARTENDCREPENTGQ